jgi:1,4-dihydroxy-2-naphthoyl-CoA hydrolase
VIDRPAGTACLVFCCDSVMQDPADTHPGPDADVDLSAEAASRFLAAAGLVDSAGGTRVAGHFDLGPDQHAPWVVVHGGVYSTAASLGASLAVRDRGQFA